MVLFWATVILISLVGSLVLMGAFFQHRRDQQNRHRIARYQDWEQRLAVYLFGGESVRGPFGSISKGDRWLFRSFLARYQSTLAGQESEVIRQLYLELGVHASLPRRLRSRDPKARARAAQEVGAFKLDVYLDAVLPLLSDTVPYVAHVAAQTLTQSQELRFAQAVMDWVMHEEHYQRERLLRVLEGFGVDLLPWMTEHLGSPIRNPEPWIIFALLAGSQRHRESQPRLLSLLGIQHLNLKAASLKALATLADPAVYVQILPLASHPAWEIRAQSAKALGVLGGPDAIPDLLALTSDRVYEVRRNAAQGLADLGHAGSSALQWLAEDPSADPFARDMARERLEWADERGHQ